MVTMDLVWRNQSTSGNLFGFQVLATSGSSKMHSLCGPFPQLDTETWGPESQAVMKGISLMSPHAASVRSIVLQGHAAFNEWADGHGFKKLSGG